MIEPVYVDLHIHTSNNPNELEENYDINTLIKKIKGYNGNSQILISLTDHNTINKMAYEKLNDLVNTKYLLGVELHIKNYPNAHLYHAHIYFNLENPIDHIDNINAILDKLYLNKVVSKDTEGVPHLEDIIRSFDEYDFILLPHGGQNHSTFNGSIPRGTNFDSTMERTIYYNQFDGFTARGNNGIEDTINYFKKLNIHEFVNLLTGTDNYSPLTYPNPKSGEVATDFVPTWMVAEPTFDGVRLSLSESNRLYYMKEKPEISSQIIRGCHLDNEFIKMNVDFTNGLNVVIGESSAGKSLLVDSVFRKIDNDFNGSNYTAFGVEDIIVNNPFNFKPHYINQNFIIDKINNKKIGDIEIIRLLFPSNAELKIEVEVKLQELQTIISSLISAIKEIESLQEQIKNISIFTKLIYEGEIQENPANLFLIDDSIEEKIRITNLEYQNYVKLLNEIKKFSINNPYMNDLSHEINKIKNELHVAREKYETSESIQLVVSEALEELDEEIVELNGELAIKKQEKDSLFTKIKKYIKEKGKFELALEKLLNFDYKIETQKVTCGGHELSIINEFKITGDSILEIINMYIKSSVRLTSLKNLIPSTLFSENFSERPKVTSYEDLSSKIYNEFCKSNKEKYSILTKEGKDFDNLSPGWKTAVILDLVFSSNNDNAPLLIDQPEDNLASTYLNDGLIKSIHRVKKQRQIIIVSHNATIPMLGDAQNVIVCKNNNGVITIKNAPLESKLDGEPIVDCVADLTDGGKTSIKKRFKKYNLKKYKGDEKNEIID